MILRTSTLGKGVSRKWPSSGVQGPNRFYENILEIVTENLDLDVKMNPVRIWALVHVAAQLPIHHFQKCRIVERWPFRPIWKRALENLNVVACRYLPVANVLLPATYLSEYLLMRKSDAQAWGGRLRWPTLEQTSKGTRPHWFAYVVPLDAKADTVYFVCPSLQSNPGVIHSNNRLSIEVQLKLKATVIHSHVRIPLNFHDANAYVDSSMQFNSSFTPFINRAMLQLKENGYLDQLQRTWIDDASVCTNLNIADEVRETPPVLFCRTSTYQAEPRAICR